VKLAEPQKILFISEGHQGKKEPIVKLAETRKLKKDKRKKKDKIYLASQTQEELTKNTMKENEVPTLDI